ncbi:MAG: hypothetical protein JWL91_1737 [Sphingomonas bacterium]|nr:murein L,D-transpeptidase catalytic domain family protein [Sphingomonas bacterium]MDB5689861.1 hypothetical protein [Sphingomonas bacterium]
MALSAGHALSRRNFLAAGVLGAAGLAAGEASAAIPATNGLRPELLQRALQSFNAHRGRVPQRDLIAIADFAQASRLPRFHLVNTVNGRTTSLLVSHGRGSDPAHTGFLSRFSNRDGSLASSAGAYVTGDTYYGKHGRSRRLIGLDPTNSNAETRGIVLHSAWYVSPQVAANTGKIGRSEGCFAVSEHDLEQVMARLGSGRMIYADKV